MPRFPLSRPILHAAIMAALVALAGCTEFNRMDSAAQADGNTAGRIVKSRTSLTQDAVTWTDKPWVNLRPVIPVVTSPEGKFPDCQITINRPEGMTLPEIGQRITAMCGLRVIITPDALQALGSGGSGSVTTQQLTGRLPAPDDSGRVPLNEIGGQAQQGASLSLTDPVLTGLKWQGQVKGLLDVISSRFAGVFGARYQHMPTPDGLYVVLRIIPDDSDNVPTLEQLGFLPEQQALIEKILRIPEGMVTLTGPTGSGKSTTLRTFSGYWLARTQGKKRLLTIEFPVEGRIAGAIQTSVTPKSSDRESVVEAWEDSNAAALRSDPDAIVIGEMQERNSVMAAIHAVESGHVVFDTLHAPSAAGAIPRIGSMGVNIQLIADPQIMVGLLSQRLVQTLCPNCRVPWSAKSATLPAHVRERLEKYCNEPGVCAPEQLWFRNQKGCEQCQKTVELTGRIVSRGVTGRTVLAEVIRPDARFMSLLLSHGTSVARQYWLQHLGGISRRTHLLRRLAEGLVDPLDGDLVCPLDEDELLACEVPHV